MTITTALTGQFLNFDGTNWVNTLKSEFAKTVAPIATDDSAAGYVVGSRWLDVTGGKEYICFDNTLATAVWTSSSSGTLNELTDVNSANDPADDTKFLRWDDTANEWIDSFVRLKQDTYGNLNLVKQTGELFKESANDNLLFYTGSTWKHIPTRDIAFDDAYANISTSFSPTVRWIPTGISGTAGSLVWNAVVGPGTINTQGSALDFVATSVGGKNAVYLNPATGADITQFIILDLGTTHSGNSDFTIVCVMQDFAVPGNNTRFISILDNTPIVGNDFDNTTNMTALHRNGATNALQSFYNNGAIVLSPGGDYTLVDGNPTVVVLRYTHIGTEWKIWINKTTDSIITTNIVDLGSLTISNIGFGHFVSPTTESGGMRLPEAMFFDSPLTDTRIQSLTDSLLVEYTVRATNSYPNYPDTIEQLTNVEISNPQLNDIIKYDGTQWINSTTGTFTSWLFSDTKSLGTVGGTAIAGSYQTRTINTTVLNGGTDATLSANQLTIGNGNWLIEVQSLFNSTDETKIRLRNVTDNSTILYSLNNTVFDNDFFVVINNFIIDIT